MSELDQGPMNFLGIRIFYVPKVYPLLMFEAVVSILGAAGVKRRGDVCNPYFFWNKS